MRALLLATLIAACGDSEPAPPDAAAPMCEESPDDTICSRLGAEWRAYNCTVPEMICNSVHTISGMSAICCHR